MKVGDKIVYNGKEFEIIEIGEGVVHILSQDREGYAIDESVFEEIMK